MLSPYSSVTCVPLNAVSQDLGKNYRYSESPGPTLTSVPLRPPPVCLVPGTQAEPDSTPWEARVSGRGRREGNKEEKKDHFEQCWGGITSRMG